MIKRGIIVGMAVIVFAAVLFFLFVKHDSFKASEAAEAVPSDALMFVNKIDYEFFAGDFKEKNLLWNDLNHFSAIMTFDSLAFLFNNRLGNMPLLEKCLKDGGLSFSLHILGKNNLASLFYVELGENVNIQGIGAEIKSSLGKETFITERKYEAIDLIDVSFKNSIHIKGFSYVIDEGILIASRSVILLENAIRALKSKGGISYQKGFQKLTKTAGKYVHANVYLNYSFIDQLFYPIVRNEFQKELTSLGEFASWGEFDVDLRENIFVFNGMSFSNDSLKGWLNVFKGQSPVKLELTSYIPSNAINFLAIGISDKELFKKQLKKELNLRDELDNYLRSENELKRKLIVSPYTEILDMLNDEIVKFQVEGKTVGTTEEVVMFEIKSKSEAVEQMESWISMFASGHGKDLGDYTDMFILDDNTAFKIYDLPEKLYQGTLIENFFKSSFAFFDNFIIFSNSHDAISSTIYQNILHKTLSNEDYYDEINNLISTRANLTCFIKPAPYVEMKKDLVEDHFKNQITSLSSTLEKIPGLIIQFANEENMSYSNISLKYTSTVRDKATTLWESLLDSFAITKPIMVINHNTSDKEILVQDATNSLYLLNSTGRIIWKIDISDPILSEIYQVDFYNNDKLQYLFSTTKGIYLLDRNGNNVEKYPVKFRSDATNGIVLFDYDNRKEYRVFVACEDRKVYVYDLEGNIVPGWSFKKTEGLVTKPIQHFKINDKDYIIFSDEIRSYILDRRGNVRINFNEFKAVSKNNLYYPDMNISENKPRFITTDTSGNIFSINIQGELETLLEHKAGSDHFFRMKDLDQDGKSEYIYSDENNLEVIDFKGKRVFSFRIKNDIRMLPDIYEFSSSDYKIGIVDKEKNQIYLLNSDGTLYEGFPLEGNTRFSIGYFAGSDSRFNLIVGSQNGFLYNYSIE